MIDATEIAKQFFEARNRHNPEDVVAVFAEGGTYCDSGTAGPLSGEQLVYASRLLFIAFPDSVFELTDLIARSQEKVAVQWIMHGTNTGSFHGHPPTGRKVELPGATFFTINGDKICLAQEYFDQETLARLMGLQVVIQPYVSGALQFGTAVQMRSERNEKPGALSLTWFDVDTQDDARAVNEYGWLILRKVAKLPGFIGYINAALGQRLYTITAWRDTEAPRQVLQNSTHIKAIKQFFGSDMAIAGHTGIWKEHRLNPLWVKCPHCGSHENYDQNNGICRCGRVLPEPPYF